MNDHSPINDPLSPQKPSLSGDALMRRRLMLRGASTGVAALAALQPVGALATTSTVLTCKNGNDKVSLCTLSGVNSAAHSFGPNVTKITAFGKTKASWYALQTWPSGCAPGSTVGSLLSGASSTVSSMLLRDILNPVSTNGTKFTTVEADFVCAYLNGLAYYEVTGPTQAKAFPYSAAKVKEFWGAGNPTRANAWSLFKAIQTSA
ncbi:MAG: hypothetical protein EOP35_00350 [Rubrivivax sp.]|nr:MAG: hypothetical protein EOP35_00350 [Rubrivivax sp.]